MAAETVRIDIRRLAHAADLPLPGRATPGAAGYDVVAAVTAPLMIDPRTWVLVPTGLQMAIPVGYEVQIRPRSGLALRHGVTVLNSPGTIDSDYRGELGVVLINHGGIPFEVLRGMRIAQMVVASVADVTFRAWDDLSVTDRGEGGFGSTGAGASLLPDTGGKP